MCYPPDISDYRRVEAVEVHPLPHGSRVAAAGAKADNRTIVEVEDTVQEEQCCRCRFIEDRGHALKVCLVVLPVSVLLL